jgi:hypothetical protein
VALTKIENLNTNIKKPKIEEPQVIQTEVFNNTVNNASVGNTTCSSTTQNFNTNITNTNNNLRLEMSKACIAKCKGYTNDNINTNYSSGKEKIIIQNILQVNDSSAMQNNNFHVKVDLTNININGNDLSGNKNEKYDKVKIL